MRILVVILCLLTVARAGPPNFVVVLVDDMGWRDVGFAGNTFVETPHLDRLAREGMVFTQAYASAPNCAPTRACLMSGQYAPRHGVYTVVDERHAPGQPHHKLIAASSRAEMLPEVITLAEALKAGAYDTACFGMWNLGRGRDTPVSPTGQGFDHFTRPQDLGFERNAYFHADGGYLPDRLTDELIGFIEAKKGAPFFAYFAPHSVHAPFDPKPILLNKYASKASAGEHDPVYAATIEALDINIGRIRKTLEREGLAENTTVVFTSDNGGNPEYVTPLRGGKGQLYEGGLRVPAFIWGYGVSGKGNACEEPIATMDVYPTLLELAHLPAAPQVDGKSLVPLLGGGGEWDRTSLFWHFPCYLGRSSPSSALRNGRYKLIEFFDGPRIELYDLTVDPEEQHDLSSVQPELVSKLHQRLTAWQQETGAAMLDGANPAYDPSAQGRKKQKGSGKKKKEAKR